MQKITVFAMWVTVLLLPARTAWSFDLWWHAEATRKAMAANGFSDDARLVAQLSNYLVDYLSVRNDYALKPTESWLGSKGTDESYDYLHFDALLTPTAVRDQWLQLQINTRTLLRHYASDKAAVRPGYREIVLLNIVGASLHTVQDFYAHSNWVEITARQRVHEPLIWTDISPAERSKLIGLRTGKYPPDEQDLYHSHDTLNKDNSRRPNHLLAFEAATLASTAWVKWLMTDPQIPWAKLRSYNVQNDLIRHQFLYNLDATFMTSSATLARKFDGKEPVRFVFGPNWPADFAKAKIALDMVMLSYGQNIRAAGNDFRLPTPYWAGFLGYHIGCGLADGMQKYELEDAGWHVKKYEKKERNAPLPDLNSKPK